MPILGVPNQHWEPFDPQGFMAYRIAMIVMSATSLLAMWELVRHFAGPRAARLAMLLGIATPFVWAELIFTWPKLLAASCILLAALWLFERRPLRAGLMIGVGYLFHPGALLGYFALGLLALWPLRGAQLKRSQIGNAATMLAGTGVFVIAWAIANRGHGGQSGFLDYVTAAAPNWDPSIGEWISFRLTSLADTLVPLYLPIFLLPVLDRGPRSASRSSSSRSSWSAWMGSKAIRAILVLRGFEIFALAIGATLGTRGPNPISEGEGTPTSSTTRSPSPPSSSSRALMMFAIWRETRPGSMLRSPSSG